MTANDPYELERLAQELEGKNIDASDHELPLYEPLSHTNPHFLSEQFNVEEFLLERKHTSLADLRTEMRDYLAMLKEELVKLINDDYEAFISLSTDLKDEGARLLYIKSPLPNLKAEFILSREGLQAVQDKVQQQLASRSKIREEKALLHLLLKISDSVTRLESLLHITTPSEGLSNSLDASLSSLQTDGSEQGDRTRGNQSKHLSRVAVEYTQVVYHSSKARAEKCAFVDEVQWRIDRIHSTLSSDLDHLFASTLAVVTEGADGQRATEAERIKSLADMKECLRTYDMLGIWRDAEDVVRREVVRPFVRKTIYPDAFTSPHSPIMPHTPFPTRTDSSSFLQPQPRTPFTPYSAFASKQNPFDSIYGSFGVRAQLLDDTDDPLANLYNQILRFVDRDLARIISLSDSTSGQQITPIPSESVNQERGFNIMANVVWAEIGKGIMDEMGGVVFAAGNPSEFRKHYETTKAFIRSLEHIAPSITSVEAMRAHPTFLAFERRWQLPVYFQLRWKEIVTSVEDVISHASTDANRTSGTNFMISQTAAIWRAIETCWSADVFIPDLGHRFWRLTLQLISRYNVWLRATVPSVIGAASTSKPASAPSTGSRSGTPGPSAEATSPEAVALDERVLVQLSAFIADILALTTKVQTIWAEELSIMLPEFEDLDDEEPKSEDILNFSMEPIKDLIPQITTSITAILTKRCCDTLLPVRSIPSQFRAISNKRAPTEPSHFVSNILRPLLAYFGVGVSDGPGAPLKNQYLDAFAREVFDNVSNRYISHLTTMRKTEESLRRLRKGKKAKSTFSLFGNADTSKDDERDEEYIHKQIILDVEAYGKDAEKLGINISDHPTFEALKELAYAVPEE